MSTAGRILPKVEVIRHSPNCYTTRSHPSLIVVHSTESANIPHSIKDLVGVADYLCRPETEASCQVITDSDGLTARVVKDRYAAWACAGFNRVSLNIEQIHYAARGHWSADEYRETARWIALWSLHYGIPLQHGRVSGLHVVRAGVVRHKDLGAGGGGHVDPGPHYDLEHAISLAKFYRGKIKNARH